MPFSLLPFWKPLSMFSSQPSNIDTSESNSELPGSSMLAQVESEINESTSELPGPSSLAQVVSEMNESTSLAQVQVVSEMNESNSELPGLSTSASKKSGGDSSSLIPLSDYSSL